MITSYLGIGSSHGYKEQYDSLYHYTIFSLITAKNYLGIYSGTYNVALNNLSSYFYFMENFKKSLEMGLRAISLIDSTTYLDNNNNKDLYRKVYFRNLGLIYKEIGDYQEALRFYQKAVAIWGKEFSNLDTINGDYGMLKLEEAKAYYQLGKYPDALKTNKLASQHIIPSNLPYINNQKVDVHHNRAFIFQKMKQKDSAMYYVNRALYYQDLYNTNLKNVTYRILANFAIEEGNFALAEKHSVRALLEAKKRYNNRFGSSYISRAHLELAHIYFLQGKFAQAEKEYRQSIAVMVNLPEGNLSINSFSPEALSHSTQLTKGFSLIGKSQWYQYQNHQDRSMLYEAFHSLQLATELIPSVYRQFQTEESRLFMAEQSIPTFEYAIKASLELHKLTGQDSFLHHAFG
ncbi:MAG: tetratricopeptide repeat protein, partial [Bacteroidetes bacterium]|nr:tetratricopeptide repeat protein [Bacteroidota bacterium]